MTPDVFAFMTDARAAVNEFVEGLLLIAGGFLVGYLLGGPAGWALGRYVFRQQQPENLKRLGRPVGGIVLALIVAIMVFTGKGKPIGEGGDGKGNPNTGGDGTPKVDEPKDKKLPPITPQDLKPADVTVRVTILEGGALPAPGKFYRLDSEDTARTLGELQAAINDRKAKEKGHIYLEIRFHNNTPPGDPRLVTDLTNWATSKAVGLTVILPPSG
jgi:hypothetical protein